MDVLAKAGAHVVRSVPSIQTAVIAIVHFE